MRKISNEVKAEVVRLRVEERLGVKAVCFLTGVSRGAVSALLRPYPLSDDEKRERFQEGGRQSRRGRLLPIPEPSRFARMIAGRELSRDWKGRIAEAAVLFRLTLFGYEVWRSAFEGNRVDWLVTLQTGNRRVRLQVRWAKRGKHGRPFVSLRRNHGRTVLTAADCDFIVGYDLREDIAYVLPMATVLGKFSAFCDPRYAEAWNFFD